MHSTAPAEITVLWIKHWCWTDELEKKRRFKPVVVGEDVLGREITGDGKSVVPSKDVPAMEHIKFKHELDEEEIINQQELREKGKRSEAGGRSASESE